MDALRYQGQAASRWLPVPGSPLVCVSSVETYRVLVLGVWRQFFVLVLALPANLDF